MTDCRDSSRKVTCLASAVTQTSPGARPTNDPRAFLSARNLRKLSVKHLTKVRTRLSPPDRSIILKGCVEKGGVDVGGFRGTSHGPPLHYTNRPSRCSPRCQDQPHYAQILRYQVSSQPLVEYTRCSFLPPTGSVRGCRFGKVPPTHTPPRVLHGPGVLRRTPRSDDECRLTSHGGRS